MARNQTINTKHTCAPALISAATLPTLATMHANISLKQATQNMGLTLEADKRKTSKEREDNNTARSDYGVIAVSLIPSDVFSLHSEGSQYARFGACTNTQKSKPNNDYST